MNKLLFLLLLCFPVYGSYIQVSGGGNTLGLSCADGEIPSWLGSGFTVCGTASGTGTVTSVALTAPAIFSVAGTPVTTTGTLAMTLATQVKNKVWAGPTTGADATPTFRLLVGADMPLPGAASLGGVFSKASVSHNFLTSISSADGSIGQAQPAFTDISGTATAAQLPLPTASSMGGVFSKAVVSNQFLTGISSVDGSVTAAQPSFSNLSGSATAAQLPNPSSSTIGGVQSFAAVTHQFLTQISTSGVITAAQPAFADLANMTGFVDSYTGFIETLANKAYTIDESAAYAYTINSIILESSGGTASLAVQIGGGSATGCSAISVSSTPVTGTCTASNSVSIGNKVTLLFSSNSSALNVGYTMKVTR